MTPSIPKDDNKGGPSDEVMQINAEKKPGDKEHDQTSLRNGDIVEEDLYRPFSDVAPYEGTTILTLRAVATGMLLGTAVACANLYLGLRTGFGADATLFSSIFGFAICKALEKSKIPFLSGHFGPHENNIIQATALGCIGIGFIFITGVPALYQLGLMSDNPRSDYGRLVALSTISGLFGLGFAVPFRSIFIVRLARELGMVFPLGTAAAVTIRSLHSIGEDSVKALQGLRVMAITFASSIVWTVGSSYAPGILYLWNPFWWIYKGGGHPIIAAVSWGWISWSWSPSLIGMGMLIDLNAVLSFVLGTTLAWGVIGPILIATGEAVGLPMSEEYPDLRTYSAFVLEDLGTQPSPRYWILWPAIALMLSTALTTVALEGKGMFRLLRFGVSGLRERISRRNQPTTSIPAQTSMATQDLTERRSDSVGKEHDVQWWEWSSMSVLCFVFALVGMRFIFDLSPEMTLFNLVLGFIWAFVITQVYGASGILATGSIIKGVQFITGASLRPRVSDIGLNAASVTSLVGTTFAAGSAQQSAELCQDFRTGFLLGTPTRDQWRAQVIGTLASILYGPALFILFTTAFPCILDQSAMTCQFALPAATSWRVITQAILAPSFPIVHSSWICAIVFALVGCLATILKRWLSFHPTWKSWTIFIPNLSMTGLAMTIPGTDIAFTLAIGCVGAALWHKFWPKSYSTFRYSVAAGGIAGEGIGNVVQAILQIASVGHDQYGSNLGCVAELC